MNCRDQKKNKKVSMNNMMILNNSFNYDQAVGASLNTKTSVDSIGFLKGQFAPKPQQHVGSHPQKTRR